MNFISRDDYYKVESIKEQKRKMENVAYQLRKSKKQALINLRRTLPPVSYEFEELLKLSNSYGKEMVNLQASYKHIVDYISNPNANDNTLIQMMGYVAYTISTNCSKCIPYLNILYSPCFVNCIYDKISKGGDKVLLTIIFALLHITYACDEACTTYCEDGLDDIIICRLEDNGDEKIMDFAFLLFANICFSSAKNRDSIILNSKMIDCVNKIMLSGNIPEDMLDSLTHFLRAALHWNLDYKACESTKFVDHILTLILYYDENIASNLCPAIKNISKISLYVEKFLSLNLQFRFISILKSSNQDNISDILDTLATTSFITDEINDIILSADSLPSLLNIIKYSSVTTSRERAITVLLNMSTNKKYIEFFYKEKVYDCITPLAINGEQILKISALYMIGNSLVNGKIDTALTICSGNLLQCIINTIKSDSQESHLKETLLLSIKRLAATKDKNYIAQFKSLGGEEVISNIKLDCLIAMRDQILDAIEAKKIS